MKGLKIIPAFLGLIVLTYLGMLFVEANHDAVTISFGSFQSHPTAIGFVVLTSMLIGMVIAGILCSVELLALYVHNKSLKRKLSLLSPQPKRQVTTPAEDRVANSASHEPN